MSSVTFMLTCYNQQKFVRDAVRGAFLQDYHPLEILISDNHSTDGTLEIVQEEIARYSGPHTVRLLTTGENDGLDVFPRTVEAARGEFIVSAHGDDVSYPNRTSCLVKAWHETETSLLSSNAEIIDAHSRVQGLINPVSEPKRISAAQFAKKGYSRYAHGSCLAWHRDVFGSFGRLDRSRLRGAHDHVLPFRGALLKGHYYVGETLMQWRVHGGNFGLESMDRTQDNLVKNETMTAYDLGARVFMLDDLDEFILRNGNEPELARLREILLEGIVGLTRRWSKSRNTLFAQEKLPTWIERKELEQRPNYSKGYQPSDGKKARVAPKKLIRKLAKMLKNLA